MPHWFEDRLLAMDLETTGLDPLADRIVQAAVLLIDADGAVSAESWSGIVDPGVPIPLEASDIHGITTERARAEGMSPAAAIERVAGLIDAAGRDGTPLVIYNAPFDWPFVLAEADRHGVAFAHSEIIDPLVLDKAVDRYRRGSRRLVDVAAEYGYRVSSAHDARADAIAAVQVARAIGRQYEEVGTLSPSALRPLQMEWFAESARSLAKYRGEPIDEGWPLPTNAAHLAEERSGRGS